MRPSRGYYCVIQYCPDLSRLEAANIGVLLFCPERDFLKARTSSDNARIRHFFGTRDHDWDRINAFKAGIEDRLEVERESIRSLDDLSGFIARRANLIQVSPPRPMKIQVARFQSSDPEQAKITACRYAAEGGSLYEHGDPVLGPLQVIVVGKSSPRRAESRHGVERILRAHHVRLFASTELDSLVEEIERTGKVLSAAPEG